MGKIIKKNIGSIELEKPRQKRIGKVSKKIIKANVIEQEKTKSVKKG